MFQLFKWLVIGIGLTTGGYFGGRELEKQLVQPQKAQIVHQSCVDTTQFISTMKKYEYEAIYGATDKNNGMATFIFIRPDYIIIAEAKADNTSPTCIVRFLELPDRLEFKKD